MCWHVSLCWLNGKVAMGTSQHGILGVVHCCPTPISVFFWSCIVFCLRYWDLWLLWVWNFDIAFGFDGLAPHQSWVSLPWDTFSFLQVWTEFVASLPPVVLCLFVPPRTLAVFGHAMRFGLRVRLLRLPRPLRPCPNWSLDSLLQLLFHSTPLHFWWQSIEFRIRMFCCFLQLFGCTIFFLLRWLKGELADVSWFS